MSASGNLDPSHALLAAAIGGLLCLGSVACSGAAASPSAPATSSTSTSTSVSADSFECPTGVYTDAGVTQSSMKVGLTEAEFSDMCNQADGILEVNPHCGGTNHCRGMSFDSNDGVFSEHTCRGTNTCAGYTCVICNDGT